MLIQRCHAQARSWKSALRERISFQNMPLECIPVKKYQILYQLVSQYCEIYWIRNPWCLFHVHEMLPVLVTSIKCQTVGPTHILPYRLPTLHQGDCGERLSLLISFHPNNWHNSTMVVHYELLNTRVWKLCINRWISKLFSNGCKIHHF